MPKKSEEKQQANRFDKIFRENVEAALPGVIEHLLEINIVSSEDLPIDIQHTKERKPDFLKKVYDKTGNCFVLHIEFQVKNDQEMVFRMAEYSIMLQRKYKLPVKQHVIYFGKGNAKMKTMIEQDDFKFRYNLVSISNIDYNLFLKSDKPEEKMWAILANFGKDDSLMALQKILVGVQGSAKSDFAESRYFTQLRVLAQLRNLEIKFIEAMENITKYFSEKKDFLYKKGKEEGKELGKTEQLDQIIMSAIINMGLSDAQIVTLSGASISHIEKIRNSIAT